MNHNHQYLQLLKIPVWTIRQAEQGGINETVEQSIKAADPVEPIGLSEFSAEVIEATKDTSSHYECTCCKLHVGCTQMIKGVGSEKAPLFVITEAPTFNEDLAGKPLAEEANLLFINIIKTVGYTTDDIYITPYIKCSPYQEFITPKEEELCYQHLKAELLLIQPQKILLLGRNVAKFFFKKNHPFDKFRGMDLTFNDLGYKIPVYVSYNPYQLLKFPEEKQKAWKDIKRVKRDSHE